MNGWVALLVGIPLILLALLFLQMKVDAVARDGLASESGVIWPASNGSVYLGDDLYSFRLPTLVVEWNPRSSANFIAETQALIRQGLTAVAGVAIAVCVFAAYGWSLWQLPIWPSLSLGDPATGFQAMGVVLFIAIKVGGFIFVALLLAMPFWLVGMLLFLVGVNLVYHYLVFGSMFNIALIIYMVMSGDATSLPSLPVILLAVTFVLSDIGDLAVLMLEMAANSMINGSGS